jgi:anti-sigma regulatory factor (Ser/Thr protein kinase)
MQREVLAFARGQTQVFARRVIVDRLLADVSEQMRPELREKAVELKLSTVPKLVAHIDSERITRALQNLIRNAAEAMAPLGGGTVRVRADVEGATLTLRVSDTGPGIPPAIAPRLFQSFVTAGKAEGTGLGLAIVKRIVEEHGGSVEHCPVPRGACFLITLPGAVESGDDSSKSEPPPSSLGENEVEVLTLPKAKKGPAKKSASKKVAATKKGPKIGTKTATAPSAQKKAATKKGNGKVSKKFAPEATAKRPATKKRSASGKGAGSNKKSTTKVSSPRRAAPQAKPTKKASKKASRRGTRT